MRLGQALLFAGVGTGLCLNVGNQAPNASDVKRAVVSKDPLQASSRPLVSVDDLVGEYYFGDGLGVNCSLELKRDHTFKFTWRGCLGEYDKNHGGWQQVGDLVCLEPKEENGHEGFEGLDVRFVPIVWEHKLFLVDEYEAPGFCIDLKPNANNLSLIRGDDYLKMADRKPAVIYLPNSVPARFEQFVGKEPIESKVLSVERDGNVWINKGASTGLRRGLMLEAIASYTGGLEIVYVLQEKSLCKPGYFFNSDRVVKVGDEFTTGGRWNRPRGTGWVRLAKPPPAK